jgi:hypothetical protein
MKIVIRAIPIVPINRFRRLVGVKLPSGVGRKSPGSATISDGRRMRPASRHDWQYAMPAMVIRQSEHRAFPQDWQTAIASFSLCTAHLNPIPLRSS